MKVEQKPVPNFMKGRSNQKAEVIVLHISVGTMASMYATFKNDANDVSSHYGVAKDGRVWQFVQESDVAFCNGIQSKPTAKIVKEKGTMNPNLYTISIEHEGEDLSKGPDKQINTTAELVADICKRQGIPLDRDHVIGHYEIRSTKPNCPGTDKKVIQKIIDLAKAINEPEPVEQKSKVLPELATALEFAHNIKIGEYIDDKDQLLMAEHLTALKMSESKALTKIEAIKKII